MKTIVALCLLLLSAAANAQLLKCIGKDGRVEYASQCPPGTRQQSTGIKNAPGATPGTAAAEKSLAEREAEFRKRQAEKQDAQAKDEKKAADAERMRQACEQARAYLKSLQARNRVAKTDPVTGERVYLDEAGYASETAAAQRSVDANCK